MMNYSIDLARKRGENSFCTETFLITDDIQSFLLSWNSLVSVLAQNGQLLGTSVNRQKDITSLRIEYTMIGKFRKARKGKRK